VGTRTTPAPEILLPAGSGIQRGWEDYRARLSIIVTDSRVRALLCDPRIKLHTIVECLGGLACARQLPKGLNFLGLLAERKRLVLIPEILEQYRVAGARDGHSHSPPLVSKPFPIGIDGQRAKKFDAADEREGDSSRPWNHSRICQRISRLADRMPIG
jgi:hypothetical protein